MENKSVPANMHEFLRLEASKSSLSVKEIGELFRCSHLYRCPEGLAKEGHSQILDDLLGLQCSTIEKDLLKLAKEIEPEGTSRTLGPSLHGLQSWVGLSHQALQTPYQTLMSLLELWNPGETNHIIDVGAGYGRFGLMTAFMYPNTKITGIEAIQERVQEGRRIRTIYSLNSEDLVSGDVCENSLPLSATHIYCYEFGTPEDIKKCFHDIRNLAKNKTIHFAARGKQTNIIAEDNSGWLKRIMTIDDVVLYRSEK